MRTGPFSPPPTSPPGGNAGELNGSGTGHALGSVDAVAGPAAPDPRPSRRVPAVAAARTGGRPPGPGVKPALIVFGLAVVIFVGGSIALALGPRTVPSSKTVTVRTAPGAPLRAVAATPLLRPIELPGQPPANVLDALALPAGSRVVAGSATNRGVENYDRILRFTVSASQEDVVRFFHAELKANGWQDVSVGTPERGPGTEVLGQHGGSDGNTWELGIIVDPTTFATSSAITGTTPFSVELYIRNLTG
jgi:hypothetical protein